MPIENVLEYPQTTPSKVSHGYVSPYRPEPIV
jgi:hypothetical protein